LLLKLEVLRDLEGPPTTAFCHRENKGWLIL